MAKKYLYPCAGCGKGTKNGLRSLCIDCWRAYNTIEAKFWRKVAKSDGCWIWTGAKYSNGYGHLCERGRNYLAHRLAWELVTGSAPPADKLLCHTCDVRQCVNPAHLFVGTYKDNAEDCKRKGRNNSGDRNGMCARRRAERARVHEAN